MRSLLLFCASAFLASCSNADGFTLVKIKSICSASFGAKFITPRPNVENSTGCKAACFEDRTCVGISYTKNMRWCNMMTTMCTKTTYNANGLVFKFTGVRPPKTPTFPPTPSPVPPTNQPSSIPTLSPTSSPASSPEKTMDAQETGYTTTVGACRGGNSPGKHAGLKFYKDTRNCRATCDSQASCAGYVLPAKSNENWCETYTSLGATGDGRSLFKCYMKAAKTPTFPPTPSPVPPTNQPSSIPTLSPTSSPASSPEKIIDGPPTYEFLRTGHCAAGRMGGNFDVSDIATCAADCQNTEGCGYFIFNSNVKKCGLFTAEAGCPDDGQYPKWKAYQLKPEAEETQSPTFKPTPLPTVATSQPSSIPTIRPTSSPVATTNQPSSIPTFSPTKMPVTTSQPSSIPTIRPTSSPVAATSQPSSIPTFSPTSSPVATTNQPSSIPTFSPTKMPVTTSQPSSIPTFSPTKMPVAGTSQPSSIPTFSPTKMPVAGTSQPSSIPTFPPTKMPVSGTNNPSSPPTLSPTSSPGASTSDPPTLFPTMSPVASTSNPTSVPTFAPTPTPVVSCNTFTRPAKCRTNSSCLWDKGSQVCLVKSDPCVGLKNKACNRESTCSWDLGTSTCGVTPPGLTEEQCGSITKNRKCRVEPNCIWKKRTCQGKSKVVKCSYNNPKPCASAKGCKWVQPTGAAKGVCQEVPEE